MPSLTFELPHWIYWTGLLVLPLAAMAAVWRARQRPPKPVSLPVAYLLWLCGGFVGLHRFYGKSLLGLVYIPLFGVILWGNAETFDARTVLSAANDDRIRAEFDVERFGEAAAEGEEGAAERVAEAEQAVIAVQQRVAAATASRDQWQTITGASRDLDAEELLTDEQIVAVEQLLRTLDADEGAVLRARYADHDRARRPRGRPPPARRSCSRRSPRARTAAEACCSRAGSASESGTPRSARAGPR